MFERLGEKLSDSLKKLRGLDKLTEVNISEGLRDIRLALLDADVHFKVVKEFIDKVKEKAIGQITIKAIQPGQQIVKIVQDELVELLGGSESKLRLSSDLTGILLCGLQGSGKTTTCAKLAKFLLKNQNKPLLVALDIQRPAAIDQLKTLGQQIDIPVFTLDGVKDPVRIAKEARFYAQKQGYNICIYDTAGRLHVDQDLMDELKKIVEIVHPQEVLLVADSMMGQDALRVAQSFLEQIDLTGIILTKIDGDARGGAALSMKHVVQKPIKFVGIGEKVDGLEIFYPDRMASRILGMGDIVSLVEKAQETVSIEEAQKMQKKMKDQTFDLNDFLEQMQQIRKMGPLQNLLKMVPGMGQLKDLNVDEKQFKRVEAIIQSMTHKERKHPEIIDGLRRRRISKGSGTNTHDINQILKQFMMMKKMMRDMSQLKKKFPKFSIPR